MNRTLPVTLAFSYLIPVVVFVVPSEQATTAVTAPDGPKPALPAPGPCLILTATIAPAVGWPVDRIPEAVEELRFNEYADEFDHLPRDPSLRACQQGQSTTNGPWT